MKIIPIMKKCLLLLSFAILISFNTMAQSNHTRIRHMAVFTLKHPGGSAEEQDFLKAIKKLADIPVVENFQVLKEVSPKNPYSFGVSMEFADRQAYNQYNNNPNHVAFVQTRWQKEVEDFMEIDFEIPD
jgi:hypothetical protein